MQISSIIIAPTPLLAANFIIFARIIQRLGTEYSRLTPWRYTIVFLPCDITALVIQGVGGGLASSADDLAGSNRGANVMLGDIAFQFAVIIVFSILGADFLWHYIHDRPVHHDPTSKRDSYSSCISAADALYPSSSRFAMSHVITFCLFSAPQERYVFNSHQWGYTFVLLTVCRLRSRASISFWRHTRNL
ncbi:RTA1 like protein-domain-containing protein [Roridomyces roridus]|uniref:RTA1 like protein-domain-containing protein n=1 Tax=Roridomyces roridus TaxID=1738132 RepID=A0AAD7B2B5_9AGAR|nr:RTA1 like protein-domain-containing protein [Roridomyces roridus]